MFAAGGWLLFYMFTEDYVRTTLWPDDYQISPVSLRRSSFINVLRFVFAILGFALLVFSLRLHERGIRRRVGRDR